MSYKTLKKWLIWERKQEKKMGCLLPRTTNMAETQDVEEVAIILLPCSVCGRTFRPEVLPKHTVICERQHAKKRRKFDSAKQRIQGTELAEFLGPPPVVASKPRPKPPSPKKAQSRWKEKHEALVKTIRDEHQTKPVDHKQCQHCDRYFGPKAFDRHVAWCKDQHAKIQVQPPSEDVSKAKQRLQARTKYRAPSFRSQRSVTKEKYSPFRQGGGGGGGGGGVGNSSTGTIISSNISSAAVSNSTASHNLTTHATAVTSTHHISSHTAPPATAVSSSPALPSSVRNINHLPRVHSNASSADGDMNSGGSRRVIPAPLTRQNSLPRASIKRDDQRKMINSTPLMPRPSRTGSLSSQGSDSVKSSSSINSIGGGDNMASSRSQLENKLSAKSSLSTNKKGKRGDGSETKRWKRHKESTVKQKSNDQVAVESTVFVDDLTETLPRDSTGKHGRKMWTRLKSKNNNDSPQHSARVERKLKKSKSKKKIKVVISPVKSSSSRKTITLSDGPEGDTQDNGGSVDVHVQSLLLPVSPLMDDKDRVSDDVHVEDDDCSPHHDSSWDYIRPQNSVFTLKHNSTDEALEDNPSETEKYEETKPLDLSNFLEVRNLDRSGESTHPPSPVEVKNNEDNSSIDDKHEESASDCDEWKDTSVEVNLPRAKSDSFGLHNSKRDHFNSNSSERESKPLLQNNSEPDLTNYYRAESTNNDDISICGMDRCSEQVTKNNSNLISDLVSLNDSLNSSESKLTAVNLAKSKSPKAEKCDSNVLKIERNPSKSSMSSAKHLLNDVVEKCECRKIFSAVKHQLYLLSKCNCMVHCTAIPLSPLALSKSQLTRDHSGNYSDFHRTTLQSVVSHKDEMKTSFSDPETYYRGSKRYFHNLTGIELAKARLDLNEIESELKLSKKVIMASATTQTVEDAFLSCSDSDNGSLCFERLQMKKNKMWWDGFRNNTESNNCYKGKIAQGSKLDREGERLLNIRRLLSKSSSDKQSNSSFSIVEEDHFFNNNSLKDTSSIEDDTRGSTHCDDIGNYNVVITSTKRLSNTREKLNRRLALREWKMHSDCPGGEIKEKNSQRKHRGMANHCNSSEHLSDHPPPDMMRLPPLGNSTPKRLNRRWSPNGDQIATGGGMNGGDNAISKFCHECGGKYPVPAAKFCCLCGVRRLAI